MAQKGKEVVEASGMPPAGAKVAKYRSFEGLRECFRIGEEYEIVLMREDESYLTQRPGCFVLSLDLLEAGLRLPVPEIAKELLRSWKVAPIQLTPNSWRTIFVFCVMCRKKKIEATSEIFRSHFSLACSPQSGMGIVYVKHRCSQLLNTVSVNHAEGYLTEYKLVKCKLSRAWDDEEIAAGRDQKEMANYAEMIPVSLCSIRLDEGGSAKGPAWQVKAAARGGAAKKAVEMGTTAGTTSLPQPKRKEKRKTAVMEPPARSRSPEGGVSDEPRVPKKRKLRKLMLRAAGDAAAMEEEPEEDLEPLMVRRSRQRAGASEERAPAAPAVDRSEAVMKMSAELGLIMVSDESDHSGGLTKSPGHEDRVVLSGEGSAEQDGAPGGSVHPGAEERAATDSTPASAVVRGTDESARVQPGVIARDSVVGESAAVLGEESTQGPGDAEEGRSTALVAPATKDGGEAQLTTRQKATGAGQASGSMSVVVVASRLIQPEEPMTGDAAISSAAAAAGGESSEDDDRPLREVLHRRLPVVPSVATLEATLRRVETSPRKLPPSPSASYLDRLARCQDLPSKRTPEVQTEEYHPENQDDDVASDVDLEALVEGISTSLGVLKAMAARSRKQKYLYEAQSAYCQDLTARHKAREADLEEEVKNLKTALQASEMNVMVARAEKDALAKVVTDAGVRAVAEYKAGPDYREELEQYGARCYRIGLNAGREFGERLSWVGRAQEAFEAAVRECRCRTNDARLDDVRFAQFQSGRMPSSDEGAGPSEQAP
ncbi:hypothetical protein Taro_004188 [Colocasia esculenta]|uniref:Transposase (putative) gypsy type domain-containing protein n=1 Tax=Colocasia esculenta TaxID=4460 RepID=A0A843TLH2_COLES|nr:hypothetical protein [Colocasia esculenta]